jgi:hypothetical protein
MRGNQRLRVWIVTILVAMGIFTIDVLTPRAIAIGVLYSALLMASLWSPQSRDTLLFAVIFGILDVLGYWLAPHDPNSWVSLNRALSIITVVATAVVLFFWRQQQGTTVEVLENIVLRLLRTRQPRDGTAPPRRSRWRRLWRH